MRATTFAQALNQDPDNSKIIMNSGITAYGMGKNREAILTGKRAIKKDPGNSPSLARAWLFIFIHGKNRRRD